MLWLLQQQRPTANCTVAGAVASELATGRGRSRRAGFPPPRGRGRVGGLVNNQATNRFRAATLAATSLLALPALAQSAHADLVRLYTEWRAFQRPAMTDGVPDYGAA